MPTDRPVYFLSDLHLYRDDAENVRRACCFLRFARGRRAATVALLGDVFWAWRGPGSLSDPSLAPFLDELRATAAAGTRVLLVHGNHDFMLDGTVADALGVEIPGADAEIVLGTERVLLTHGDRFCTRDESYQRLHRRLRSRPMRWVFRELMTERAWAWFEGYLPKGKDRDMAGKAAETMDIVDAEVRRALAAGPDVVVCGHVHRAREATFPEGRLLVLADFETTGSHAVREAGRWTLLARDPRFTDAGARVVTIDGPAGSGKSSVAARLATRLGWRRLDSGAVYRAVTAEALRRGLALDPPEPGALAALVGPGRPRVEPDGSLSWDGRPVPDETLRSAEVSRHVSPVSADAALRRALLPVQWAAAEAGPGLVADGRDMASVVFPAARHRFYLDAPPEVRAARRRAQGGGEGSTDAAVAAALLERDRRDASRAAAPLVLAEGVERVDTADLTLDEVVETLARRVTGDI